MLVSLFAFAKFLDLSLEFLNRLTQFRDFALDVFSVPPHVFRLDSFGAFAQLVRIVRIAGVLQQLSSCQQIADSKIGLVIVCIFTVLKSLDYAADLLHLAFIAIMLGLFESAVEPIQFASHFLAFTVFLKFAKTRCDFRALLHQLMQRALVLLGFFDLSALPEIVNFAQPLIEFTKLLRNFVLVCFL